MTKATLLKRGLLIAAGIALAICATVNAAANIMRRTNIEAALAIDAGQPQALARKADMLFYRSQSPKSVRAVEKMAKRALERQALNAPAMRLLGYISSLREDPKAAQKRILVANSISRRDFGTQLWLIEDAAARDDIKAALVHYDIALRTNKDSQTILFATLDDGLATPEVRSDLARYLTPRSTWFSEYLRHAINSEVNPSHVASVVLQAGGVPEVNAYSDIDNSLLEALFARGEFATFGRYYASLKGAQRSALTSTQFGEADVNPRYRGIGWQLVPGADSGGNFAKSGKNYALQAFAGSGVRSWVAVRNLFFKPGAYQFLARQKSEGGGSGASLIWSVNCIAAGGKSVNVWREESDIRAGGFTTSGRVDISADCPAQQLILSVVGGAGQTGAEVTIKSVSLR